MNKSIAIPLAAIENTLNELVNTALNKSVTHGDDYCNLSDSIIDLMESVQVCRKKAVELEKIEDEATPDAKPVPMG